jgi:hypothetical protein
MIEMMGAMVLQRARAMTLGPGDLLGGLAALCRYRQAAAPAAGRPAPLARAGAGVVTPIEKDIVLRLLPRYLRAVVAYLDAQQ